MKRLLGVLLVVVMANSFVAARNPVPFVNQPLVPATVQSGHGSFGLEVNGTGFASNAVITWNGSTRITTFVSHSRLKATIDAKDVATAGTAVVGVQNPGPGGGNSNTVLFPIQTSLSSVVFFDGGTFGPANAVGDFNGDGILDIAVGSSNSDGSGTVDVYFGKGNGKFSNPVETKTVVPIASLLAADFNNDGHLDLAALDGLYTTIILLGDGKGNFSTQDAFRSPKTGMAVGDFNNDGKLDLAISDSYLTKIFLGNGDGTFTESTTLDGTLGPAVGDFNQDGNLDLALHQSFSIEIYLGNGDGTFQRAGTYSEAFLGIWIAVADVNGDGKLDLITDGLSVLLGNGDGTFTSDGGVDLNLNTYPTAGPLLADFNGDGYLDAAVPDTHAGLLHLLLGNGDGTFQAPVDFTLGMDTNLGVGDFNGDGKLDLVSSNLLWQVPVGLSRSSLNFGNQKVGTKSKPQAVTLTNGGVSTLDINKIGIKGADPNDFSEFNGCGHQLKVGASCEIVVTFQPQKAGQRAATLYVSYKGLGSPQTVALSGNGASATVSLTPSKMNFHIHPVGTVSKPQTATLTNTGTIDVNISNIATTGAYNQTNNCPASLPPNGSCQIQVTFTPVDKGSATGKLQVTDDADGSPQSVALSGIGTIVKLSSRGINFGDQKVGTKSSAAPVKLTNVGKVAVNISSIDFAGADPGDFSQTNDCGNSVPAGGSCTIKVFFTPQAKGSRSANLEINDDGGGSPQKVALTGIGT